MYEYTSVYIYIHIYIYIYIYILESAGALRAPLILLPSQPLIRHGDGTFPTHVSHNATPNIFESKSMRETPFVLVAKVFFGRSQRLITIWTTGALHAA